MGENLPKDTQFSIFETIRTLLLTNSTIRKYFNKKNFYRFEPNLKSNGTNLPLIVIKIPLGDETDLLVLNHRITFKSFETPIIFKIGFEAKAKAIDFTNAIVATIEQGESTLNAAGIQNVKISVDSVDKETENQKDLVVGQFVMSFDAGVSRI